MTNFNNLIEPIQHYNKQFSSNHIHIRVHIQCPSIQDYSLMETIDVNRLNIFHGINIFKLRKRERNYQVFL